jgi:serine/threonine protein phosphatase PrpC
MNSPEFLEVSGRPSLLAVADGLGGYGGGALAARIVADTLSEACRGRIFPDEPNMSADEESLRALFCSALSRMASAAGEDRSLCRMGAVAAGVLLRERTALVFNCGDCRVYRISGGVSERLTREHSVVEALFESGRIDTDGMRTHPRKNIVTSSISLDMSCNFEIYTRRVSRCGDDAFFICSDGVWEALPSDRLAQWLSRDPEESAQGLFDDLMKSQCRDNVSFIWQTAENG